MAEIVLQEQTKQAVTAFIANPAHALVIVGPNGAGKHTLAREIAEQLLENSLTNHPYATIVDPVGDNISIEEIRNIQSFLKLKTTGRNTWRRVVIIVDAHRLTTEAQNAFLKILEEPPQDTITILTINGRDSVLPTITSRAQVLHVKPVKQSASLAHFQKQGYQETDITKAYHMSNGQVGLMSRLLDTGDQTDELLTYIDKAKWFLGSTSFERLIFVDDFQKQKLNLSNFLWALKTVCQAGLHQTAKRKGDVKAWQIRSKRVLAAIDQQSANPSTKLLLTDLALSI